MTQTAFPTPSFSVKRTAEFRRLAMNFVNYLEPGETISNATFSVVVLSGTDANPSAMLSGGSSIVGSVCKQLVVGGVDGVRYLLKCLINTSLGQRLEGIAILPVSDSVQ